MKKYLILTSIFLASVTSLSAQGVAGTVSVTADDAVVYTTAVQTTPGSRGEPATVTVTATPHTLPVKVMAGTATAVRAMPVEGGLQFGAAIVTGDATVDAKLRTLQEEYVKKMKALNAEYDAKVKATMGNLKPQAMQVRGNASMQAGVAASASNVRDAQGNAIYTTDSADVQIREGELITVDANGSTTVGAMTPFTQLKGFFFRFFQ